ncbi:MAG: medium chain dehydrogenase/reductase family protein [Mycobacteriales bacterium]
MYATEIVLPHTGEPEVLQVRQRELGEPGPGQALVRIEASGVGFAEQQMRRGRYPAAPKFPFVPGYDLVGTVEGTGERVAAMTKSGGWATYALVDRDKLVPVPADAEQLDAAEAEVLILNGVTAWQMLHRQARVRRGQTVLVHGANSGVGTLLVQLAREVGATVIGTASARNLAAVEALGATAVDRRGDWAAEVRRLAPGGVHAVFDHVGVRNLRLSRPLLARGGTLISYGSAATRDDKGAGQRAAYAPFLGILASLALWTVVPDGRRMRLYNVWGGSRTRPDRWRRRFAEDLTEVLTRAADGRLKAVVGGRYPLTEAAEALRVAESGTVVGRLVLIP